MPRLDQLLASLGYGSRREVHRLIDEGRVTLTQVPADDPSAKVDPREVLVDGEPLDHPGPLLLMLHKPLGVVCSHDLREGPSVYDLLPERWRRRNPKINSVGRLDKETSGLLLLTDQTELVHRFTSPKHKVSKVYLATLDKDVPSSVIALFSSGELMLEGEDRPCLPAELTILSPREVKVELTEGRYHQVRRMFLAACGATVLVLHRANFGRLSLGALAPGKFKPVDENEV